MLLDLCRRALDARGELLVRLADEGTDVVRLLHGAAEGRPGLTVDRYGPILLVQTFREPLEPGELQTLSDAVQEALGGTPLLPVWNHRGRDGGLPWSKHHAVELPEAPTGREGNLLFDLRPRHRGLDPLLFVDFRAGRRAVREAAPESLLNCFAYTCGIGVAARAGGTRSVLNVDFAASALEVGRRNAALNGFDDAGFETLHEDFFAAVRQFAGLGLKGRRGRRTRSTLKPRRFDGAVLDPPRWARSAHGAVDVVRDYPSLLKPVLLSVKPGGFVLATNHVPSVDLADWLDVLTRCAAKAGRPLQDLAVIQPDEDVPSPDGRPPLKMAWLRV